MRVQVLAMTLLAGLAAGGGCKRTPHVDDKWCDAHRVHQPEGIAAVEKAKANAEKVRADIAAGSTNPANIQFSHINDELGRLTDAAALAQAKQDQAAADQAVAQAVLDELKTDSFAGGDAEMLAVCKKNNTKAALLGPPGNGSAVAH